jgi:hypothetical protein
MQQWVSPGERRQDAPINSLTCHRWVGSQIGGQPGPRQCRGVRPAALLQPLQPPLGGNAVFRVLKEDGYARCRLNQKFNYKSSRILLTSPSRRGPWSRENAPELWQNAREAEFDAVLTDFRLPQEVDARRKVKAG